MARTPRTRYANRLNPGNNRSMRIVPLPSVASRQLLHALFLSRDAVLADWQSLVASEFDVRGVKSTRPLGTSVIASRELDLLV